MTNPFLSSEEYDERAHALYNDGRYEKAVELLREGLGLYPSAVELHVGMAYAWLAQEEFVWARRSFEEALILDPEHEDALAGLGDALLRFGLTDAAMRLFDRVVALGYTDDGELMVQIGRSLFREEMHEEALAFFNRAIEASAGTAEVYAWRGIILHRLDRPADAIASLRTAVGMDPDDAEIRLYLANVLFETGELDASLLEFRLTKPEDHWDEIGIRRYLALEKDARGDELPPEFFREWEDQLRFLNEEAAPEDILLTEVIEKLELSANEEPEDVQTEQLESLGYMLVELAQKQGSEKSAAGRQAERQPESRQSDVRHSVQLLDGTMIEGTWEEIVGSIRDLRDAGRSVEDYMAHEARMHYGATGVRIATHGAEAFIRDSADAGLLRIIR